MTVRKPDVFFSGIKGRKGRTECLAALLDAVDGYLAGFKKGSFVGIKMTVGDSGNKGYLKPDIVGIVVDRLKSHGTKPFIFDTNVIYRGQRQNAVDHMNLAYSKGFTPGAVGCPYIIADGVFGTDSTAIKVDFKNIKEIRVPSFLRVLDDLMVLSHVTGHMMSGFAGSIKNVAMGMASRAGKQIQHSSVRPSIKVENCTLCGCCMAVCPVSAISDASGRTFINSQICAGCGECIAACKFDAVNINWQEDAGIFAERMAEYAGGILSRIKRKLFVNFAFDITEECDCLAGDDPKAAEDAGIFASDDILAVDKSSYDMLMKDGDIFSRNGKITSHLHLFEYAQKIGLGSLGYKIICV